MSHHVSWETFNDLVDGVLPARLVAETEAHVRECAACSATLTDLRSTLGDLRELPDSITPPGGLWTDIRSTIEARKVTRLPVGSGERGRGWWMTPRRAAIAASLLVAVSVTLTSLVLGARQEVLVRLAEPAAVAVSWQASEREFLASVLELREQLAMASNQVSPETTAKIERALSTIDVAIAEAREALLNDPANTALSEILATNYRQKIDLLRRATQLGSST